MDEVSFKAKGHENISCMHKNTFEFTKDSFVTKNGDCIAGIDSDFTIPEIFCDGSKCEIKIECDGRTEKVFAVLNPDFCSKDEIVIRKSNFSSPRTFALEADKACKDFSRDFATSLKNEKAEIFVTIRKIK